MRLKIQSLIKNMLAAIQPGNEPKQELYVFRGKEFMCDRLTIAQLNYALALNRVDERYVLKKDASKKSSQPLK